MGEPPDKVLNPDDPGDETQKRYRYQAVRACCYILALFDDEEGIQEIFCEHHEDVLVKELQALEIDGRLCERSLKPDACHTARLANSSTALQLAPSGPCIALPPSASTIGAKHWTLKLPVNTTYA